MTTIDAFKQLKKDKSVFKASKKKVDPSLEVKIANGIKMNIEHQE